MAKPVRTKNKDNARRSKKKVSVLNAERVDYIDYKDVNLLRRFMSDRAKIRARRVTGNDSQQQKEVARAIKNAREMALLPYANRITQQRGGRGDRGDRPRRRDDDAPMPLEDATVLTDPAERDVPEVDVPDVDAVEDEAGFVEGSDSEVTIEVDDAPAEDEG
jgi:small subunit ribosomal protein S18